MKVLERILEKRIRCQVSIDNMQVGFMPGKGITGSNLIMRQERHQSKDEEAVLSFCGFREGF